MARALAAQPVVGRAVGRGEIGQLVDHDVGGGLGDGAAQAPWIQRVGPYALRAARADPFDALGRAGDAGHAVAGVEEQGEEEPADHARGAREEHMHVIIVGMSMSSPWGNNRV
ncbi:hypothetical protein GCM10010272_46620 [Streptomyces lateritius]|nr:hypothetical protein GCM10010272_46620 [Streptomyces lateritius]